MTNPQNLLASETSPYLLQHADNPVNWRPWNRQALDESLQQDKPILLSIGYSACHWCHVMAHESFEDEETAALMNRLFVNIKVDREERPDLDKIYQQAHQLLTQRPGGWPLTVFLMPEDQVPFFAGTYFPDRPRHGMPDFKTVLQQIAAYYREHKTELQRQNQSLLDAVASLKPKPDQQHDELPIQALDIARRELEQSTDKRYGGFGKAPKFPHPYSIERLLRHWAHTGGRDRAALETACLTLDAMANGGVHDQLGGGFCRYSVDDYWMIPHFEKMLYDNGALLGLYSQAWQATANPLYRRTAELIADWTLREMQAAEGGYYASLDADSETDEGKHEEGAFYRWTDTELKQLLDQDEFSVFALRFGIDRKPNFEGYWYPHVFRSKTEIARQLDCEPGRLETLLQSAIKKAFNARAQRIRPGRDEKILTSWNALMIKGMAIAGRLFDRADYIDSAKQALDFIRTRLWHENRLLACYKDGQARLNAYLDDYAFLIDAGLELLQAEWDSTVFAWMEQLAETLLVQFHDQRQGGFYFTSTDHERLFDRPKPLADDAVPSGNGVAACALARLGHLNGDLRFIDACKDTLYLAQTACRNYASAYNSLLRALEEYHYGVDILVVRGDRQQTRRWQQAATAHYQPRRLVFCIPATAQHLPAQLAEKKALPGEAVTAWLCSGSRCQPPVTDFDEFKELLTSTAQDQQPA